MGAWCRGCGAAVDAADSLDGRCGSCAERRTRERLRGSVQGGLWGEAVRSTWAAEAAKRGGALAEVLRSENWGPGYGASLLAALHDDLVSAGVALEARQAAHAGIEALREAGRW